MTPVRFGLVGYGFRKLDIPKAPLIFGLILGGMVEQSFRQAMTISGGSPFIFVKSPIAAFLRRFGVKRFTC